MVGTDHHIDQHPHHSPTDLFCGKSLEEQAAWRVGDNKGIVGEDVGPKGRRQGEGEEEPRHGREDDQAPKRDGNCRGSAG